MGRADHRGKLRHVALVLLRHAGHDGHDEQTASRLVGLGRQRVLHHRAHHLVRRFGAGKLGRELRVVLLHEAHPAGTAAREHGARRVGAEEFHELAALLHNGEVGGEIGVEDLVEAHGVQGRGQASRRRLLAGKPQALAPGRAHGRRHLHHGFHRRIQDGLHDEAHVVTGRKRPGGAMGDALAAQGAPGLGDGQVVAHDDLRGRADPREVPHGAVLHLLADGHAAHALDALAAVALQREVGVPGRRLGQGTRGVGQVEGTGKIAQSAGVLAHARGAQRPMIVHDGLQVRPSGRRYLRGVGAHPHALAHGGVAGGRKPLAFHVHQTHAARADAVQVLQVAQRGDGHTSRRGRVQHARALGGFHRLTVYRDCYHASSPLPVSAPMPYTSQRRQRPHSWAASSALTGSSTYLKSHLRSRAGRSATCTRP